MSDLVARLRNWRDVHLARLHLLMEEAADQIAILESKLSLRENLEQGLMAGVARLQAEVERLRNGALEASGTVSQNGDFPESENVANQDILTAEEREAVEYFAAFHQSPREADATAAAALRGLLERTK